MPRVLTDGEIQKLLAERKKLPAKWRDRLKTTLKSDMAFKQRKLDIMGDDGSSFRLLLRESMNNPMDFSVILMFDDKDGSEYCLCRYNGLHRSEHTNKLEKRAGATGHTFKQVFHIHQATERYQKAALPIAGYAVETKAYNSFDSAVAAFAKDNGFFFEARQNVGQMPLFPA